MMKKNEVKKGFIANKYKKNKLIKNGFFTNRHNKLLKLGVILGFSISFLLGGCVNQHPDKEQASTKETVADKNSSADIDINSMFEITDKSERAAVESAERKS